MNVELMNLSTTIEAVQWYLKYGFKVVPIPREGTYKSPADRNWPKKNYDLSDFTDDHNVGLRQGEEIGKDSFLADVDIDLKLPDKTTAFPGAAEVVAAILPPSGFIFGRDAAPRSHLGYITTRPVLGHKYHGLDDETLIELRGLNPKAKTPQHTVAPPGVHASRQHISFAVFDMALFVGSLIPADALTEHVKYAAVALALLRVWPGVGKRHDARLAFAKVLLEANLDVVVIRRILEAVTRATSGNVGDVERCVVDTASKDAKDTVGSSWIAEHLERGAAILKVIDTILGVKRRPSLEDGHFVVTDIDLRTLTPAVWNRVIKMNEPATHFLQGGFPVRAIHIPENPIHKKRPAWVLQALESDRLRNAVAQVTSFYVTTKSGNLRQIAPPSALIDDMLATPPGKVDLPIITRIVYAPTIGPDGSVQTASGYQPATSTFYVEPTFSVPPVAETPADADVARAVRIIREPLEDFSFVADSDRTHAVGLMLLPFVRGLIDGPTPLHLFTKPVAGAGATLLVDTLLYPSLGTNIARMTTVEDEDEWRKGITSTLLDGPTSVVIDNARNLVSMNLAQVITGDIWQARILGISRNAVLRVECAWVATGINPVLHQEIARRIVPCRIDPKTEQPWLRTEFKIKNLRGWLREHQPDLIWAALTLARAWYVAGRASGKKSLGMFESWAHVIGGILQHAGFAGFLENLGDLYEGMDVEGDAVRWFFEEWKKQHWDNAVKISDLRFWALKTDAPVNELLSAEKGQEERFSKWVRRLKNRVVNVDGQSLSIAPVRSTGKSQTHTWKLFSTDGHALRDPDIAEADPALLAKANESAVVQNVLNIFGGTVVGVEEIP